MTSIIVHSDPGSVTDREINDVAPGALISEWVMNRWPNGLTVPVGIHLNDVTEADLLFTLPGDGDAPDHMIAPGEVIHIVRYPQEFAARIFSIVFNVASTFLLKPNVPVPDQPEFDQPQESPNNSLSGQTNIARPLQRIPDLYGKNRIYPDLIAPSYFEFISNVKFVTEYMCLGRGEFLVESIKSGDTLITDIEGASAEIFEPFTAPSDLLKVIESNEVNGQELAGPNDSSEFTIDDLFVDIFSGSTMLSPLASMSQFASLDPGTTFTISNSALNNGVFTFQNYNFISFPEPLYTVTVSETFTTDGNDTIDITGGSPGKASEYGPFIVPGDPDEIWIDILAPKGLRKIDGTTKSAVNISFEIDIQELDSLGAPVGAVQTTIFNIQDNTLDPLFFTFKFTPTNPGNPHEATVRRLTNTIDDSTIQIFDQTKWSRLAGVENISVSDFGNVTTIRLITQATEQATKIQRREFNMVATRKLRTYDTGTQTVSVATAATAKVADAALQHLTDPEIGNKPISQIDLDELYEVQDRLDADAIYGDALGRFCYSFSNSKTPVGDELQAILNASRMMSYREGSLSRFVRDEIQPNRTALFNSRVKGKGAESKVINFFKPGDQDGVELRWVDEITGDSNTILLPDPIGGTNNLRINAAGIKNFEQAWNRAAYEFSKVSLQRTNVSTKVTNEGILPRLNDRVANVDGTNISAQGGEIITVAGLTVGTDRIVDFGVSSTGTVILRGPNGDPSDPLDCIPRTDGINGFTLTESPSFSIFIRSDTVQIGTLYSFFAGPDADHDANDYLIGKIDPQENGFVSLVLVNYRPEIYDADTTNPPT